MWVKRKIVEGLEAACALVDKLSYWPMPFQVLAWWFGCPRGLGLWSSKLDKRWETNVWKTSYDK